MNVLVVGSGGREHAFVDAVSRSPQVGRILAAPGNPGIAEQAECFDVPVTDVAGMVALARAEGVDLVIVGPEGPLVAGLVDALRKAGVAALGPTASAAHLEGSKAFMKELCRRSRIPTASYRTFSAASEAIAYCETLDRWPSVIKVDGLAAGKGVIIARTPQAAINAVRSAMLDGHFGDAGERIVIEDFVQGEELSMIALVDGESVAVLESSRDHKAAYDGDLGPNTGGMGAFSPSALLTPRTYEQIEERILIPTVHAMAKAGRTFSGFLYAGLMITDEGPVVLEYNVRGGDPEIEVLLPRLTSDPLELFAATANGTLAEVSDIEWSTDVACGVVLADGDYPGTVTPGKPIRGVAKAAAHAGVKVFHMGTRVRDGRLETAGGRVLCVTAVGATLKAARDRAYAAADEISFEGLRRREDIGWRELGPVADTLRASQGAVGLGEGAA